jgi:HAD superfamily hydrolase (TIGR01450 family)
VVLDLDGCIYVGSDPVPGAREALEAVRGAGFLVLFATNNSTKTPQAVAGRLEDITGFAVGPDGIVTSALAAATLLDDLDNPVLPIGESGLVAAIIDAGRDITEDPDTARAVIVGLDRAISYDRIRRAARAVILGARFIGTNHDPTFPTNSVPAPGAGSIVAAVERASGQAPEYAGKPFAPMRHAIEKRLGPGPTWMVGDRPDTDIACGRIAGWTTVLVRTGVAPHPDQLEGDERPDHVIPTVAELPGLLGL